MGYNSPDFIHVKHIYKTFKDDNQALKHITTLNAFTALLLRILSSASTFQNPENPSKKLVNMLFPRTRRSCDPLDYSWKSHVEHKEGEDQRNQ
jgi:hypothetical protein